ncbi:methionine ABC transporter substrate-binding protein [Vibrio sp. UCD-FRSSP16_10]|uniref:MetQ/NlpA family ABC transporter substrate-binding protein n=1 Tax=unclassified Vibrio TaxID=2614977 RepID=UPI000802438F|nr:MULTISPECIES: MetQ/NlpA family ABC transporter substrate-binding protein [unclassified Vibrio]OBT16372.1 methionine ABC transporter substrate-binding protein [Vibrio sp. UCD-FRSSP16_30]OBT21236.1 methionine ABC transporter substrate-binding protein [Vibrio sp. UCD-FRSSP16_10]
MKGIKQLVGLAFISALVLGLSACGQQEAKVIKIGATVGPHAQVVEAVAKEAAKQGIKVEVVQFSDYITPNAALEDGSIDLNSYQHQPFLDNYNEGHNSHLVSIGRSILMRMGIYSNKFTSIDALPNEARVAIPNDPTNGGRGLLLLEEANLITLKPGVGSKATLQDITANPKHLKFVEVDAAQLPRSLDDVDAAAITMNYVMSAGLDPKKQGIYLESKDAPLAVMVIAAKEDQQNNPGYLKLVKIFQSQATRDFLQKTFKGTIEPAF